MGSKPLPLARRATALIATFGVAFQALLATWPPSVDNASDDHHHLTAAQRHEHRHYEKAYGDHRKPSTEGVKEIVWTGKLLDEHYDEFGIQMKLPDTPHTILYFPAVQECETGVHRWIEIPEAGKTWGDYKSPAPMLKLGPKSAH